MMLGEKSAQGTILENSKVREWKKMRNWRDEKKTSR